MPVVPWTWPWRVARGAAIHGEILGYGLCTDPGYITKPSAQGQAQAMQAALRSAGLYGDEVDAINAHGTGTRAQKIPVSATKALRATHCKQRVEGTSSLPT